MSGTQTPIAETPDVSIRARPPSPRRLSRRVLLGGAVVFGAIVVVALVTGLGDRPSRVAAAREEALASGGVPESIRLAPTNYDSAGLLNDEGPADEELELVLPEERARGEITARAPAGPAPGPDPAETARLSPILFDVEEGPAGAGARAPVSGRRAAFINAQRDDHGRLEARLSPPRGRFEILAGDVIPAALQTELNSDLPGRVVARVTANVFDSVTGRHLLIPQGSRLIGAYDSATAYGDARLLLVWNRLILPNGWSIDLQGMEGVDPSGAAGLRDRVDNHLARLAGTVVISSIIGVTANEAESESDSESFRQSLGAAAAQEAARSGARIVDRELAVQPTLRVRGGAPVRVLVMRDISLRPYDD